MIERIMELMEEMKEPKITLRAVQIAVYEILKHLEVNGTVINNTLCDDISIPKYKPRTLGIIEKIKQGSEKERKEIINELKLKLAELSRDRPNRDTDSFVRLITKLKQEL